MKSIKPKANDSVFVFKAVSNGNAVSDERDPKPVRIIGVPGSANLYQLAGAIIESFDFYFDHSFGYYDQPNLHEAEIGYELFADIGEESDYPGVKKTLVPAAFPELNKALYFLFDYGDDWWFEIKLTEIRDVKHGMKYPVLLEKIGESPKQYPSFEDEEGADTMVLNLELTVEERDLVNETLADENLLQNLKNANPINDKIQVEYNEYDLEELLGYIASEANHTKNKTLQKKLDMISAKIEKLLDISAG